MEMARPTKTNGVGVQVEDTQICVVMVGLPARGKSLIAQKGMCSNFISWMSELALTPSHQLNATSNGFLSTPKSST